ncbi:hypothetical protein GYMLUDRAFT_818157 [Collybiopsis luxurians FD-317 M1]|uniref:Uncharacterized protein n=1 Tax=Collybiopsis luxurians FD-317 M1 TaxID=944289 RepID=A0A0D0BN22_9AGAR|nr:hypothetical protein GYMLUDRAFT_818157 [Collybiopsis luxurians FD-317 M1]
MTEWVLRSSSLDMDLIIRSEYHRKNPSKIQKALYRQLCKSAVMQFSTKWRRLNLLFFWEAHDFFSHVLWLPALEELTFHVDEHDSVCPDILFTEFLHLQKLNFCLLGSPSSRCLQNLVPTTVVDLTLRGEYSEQGLTDDLMGGFLPLGKLQYLTRLEIDQGFGWFDPHALPATRLPALLDLSLRGSSNFLADLLGVLTLPSLQRLIVELANLSRWDYVDPRVGSALVQLQKRSRFSLTLLSMVGVLEELHLVESPQTAVTWPDFSAFLSVCSSIQELWVCSTGLTDAGRLMNVLRYNPEKTMLPHLKVFTVSRVSDSGRHFLNFICSRWWADNSQQKPVGVERLERLMFIGCELRPGTRKLLKECYKEVMEQRSDDAHGSISVELESYLHAFAFHSGKANKDHLFVYIVALRLGAQRIEQKVEAVQTAPSFALILDLFSSGLCLSSCYPKCNILTVILRDTLGPHVFLPCFVVATH